jgi:23S rRNA pseudouridine2605 synthase
LSQARRTGTGSPATKRGRATSAERTRSTRAAEKGDPLALADAARSTGARRARTPRGGQGSRATQRAGGVPDRADDGEGMRLNKALSAAGLGSRRAVEELIRAGRVAIDGQVVEEMGRRVDPANDRVEVDGSRVVIDERLRYWMLNKPLGVVSTADDPQGRPTVVEFVPENPRVVPVGRLDRDTEGLILLTNDGELANRLTHPRYGVKKRYLAEVERLPGNAVKRVQEGVELDDGLARAERVRVVAGSGRRRMVEVVMVEGRKREVRRLLEAVGAPVRRLVRTAIGPLRLTGLAPGEYRPLRPDEVRGLYRSAGL